MTRIGFRPLFTILGVLMVGFAPVMPFTQQVEGTEKVILVDLRIQEPKDAGRAYSSQFDGERVEVDVPYDDPLFTLEDFSFSEDALDGPDCFMPQLKMIFRENTYVFSLYCTSVVKYRNQAPFKPSSKTMRSDIKVTESVLDYLQKTREKYFKDSFDPSVAKKFHKVTGMKDVSIKVDDSEIYKDEDAADDKELEKDAIDKDGWFDNTKDPGLEDETPDVEDGDED